jgi:hypothetical protein
MSSTKVTKSKFGTLAVQQAISTRNVRVRKNRHSLIKPKFAQVSGIGRRVFQHQLVFGKIKEQDFVATIERDVDAIAITNLNEHVTENNHKTFGRDLFFAGVALSDSSAKQQGDAVAVARTGLLTVINSGHKKILAGDHVMWLLPNEINPSFDGKTKSKNPIGYYGVGLPDAAVHPVLASYNAANIRAVDTSALDAAKAAVNASSESLEAYADAVRDHAVQVNKRVIGFALSSADVGKPIDIFFM